MKFLLDENIPPSLVLLLKKEGHEARHVVEIGYNNTPDFKISSFAAGTNEVILTHDTDFGTILALSGDNRPSVILFRLQVARTADFMNILNKYLPQIESALETGALVIIDDNKIRIRSLPLLR